MTQIAGTDDQPDKRHHHMGRCVILQRLGQQSGRQSSSFWLPPHPMEWFSQRVRPFNSLQLTSVLIILKITQLFGFPGLILPHNIHAIQHGCSTGTSEFFNLMKKKSINLIMLLLKLLALRTEHTDVLGSSPTADLAIATVQDNIKWMNTNAQVIVSWLKEH